MAILGSVTSINRTDHERLKPVQDMPKFEYPKYDGVLTFDKLTNISFLGTNHEE